ncbi:hypothetical protein [Lysinibacillus sphaericus]|nr:hypothetical protein [Lysinibacillus sphaericus]
MGISVTDETLQRSEAAHRTPPRKAPGRNGNQRHAMVMSRMMEEKEI